jgi:alpha-mannosidase
MPARLRLESAGVVTAAFKPSDDGRAVIVRLFNPTGEAQTARLNWTPPVRHTWLSSAEEEPGGAAPETVSVPALDTVTLRVEP